MPRFKIQSGKTPFKNPWGGETSWVEMEAEDLDSVLIKCRLKYPDTPILNVFAKRWTVPDGSHKGKVVGGELLFSTFEEIPE